MSRLGALFRRETSLAWGRGGGPLVSVGFYAGVATLLPLAIGPEPARLAAIAPGAAWVALALASLLSLDRLFERDFEDGALDLLSLSPVPLELTCAVKCAGQWLAAGAPLAVAAPVAAIGLGAPLSLAPLIFACALIGGLAAAVHAAGDLRRGRPGGDAERAALDRRVRASRGLCRGRRGAGSAGDGRGLPQRPILSRDGVRSPE